METKHLDINEQGLSVRCKLMSHVRARQFPYVALATYGFGGTKENHVIERFAEKLTSKHKSWAVLTFDWPGHGADARKRLSVPESMEYQALATRYAHEKLGAERLGLFATSYGGYVALRAIAEQGDPFERVVLRSPAIDLHKTMLASCTADELSQMARGKKVLKGWDRKVELDQEFLDDLAAHDVRAHEYFDVADSILVIHGTRDDSVPLADSRAFCEANVIELVEIEGADHPFSNPKHLDLAIDAAVTWLGSA